ncbi:DUF4893 domain-containing protein [Pelagibacterium montanilacus]|uniref:DUF4893 domain-containing protein n=1 Tax=Pelagibacterium montanilacus TaxID=2185280 RepID=UPI0013E050F0|nr:DUF4893 domain-containing protein [Pelagibacterium montanilacus]
MPNLIVRLAAVLAMVCAPAFAQDQEADPPYHLALETAVGAGELDRLEGWQEALPDAVADLGEAPEQHIAEAAAQVLALVNMETRPLGDPGDIVGDWSARTLLVDGLGAYSYPYFPARIYREGRALVFDKNSGSQRHRGLMADTGQDRYLFAGALYYRDEEPRLHSAHMAGSPDPERDALAWVYRLAPDHYLMAFAPRGGQHRLYELRR